MKRILLSLMALVALVLITNTALAQDKWAPVAGASYDYSVSGINPNGSTYAFSVNTSTSTAGGSSSATITGAATGSIASGSTGSATIEWLDAGTYNLWLEVTGTSTECTSVNRRYVPVTVTANDFDVAVVALGTSVSTTWDGVDWTTDGAQDDTACPEFAFGYNFLNSAGNDGSSYVYFRVDVLDKNLAGYDWNLNLDFAGTGTFSDIKYSSANAGSWTDYTDNAALSNLSAGSYLFRVSVENATSSIDVTAEATATENVGNSTVDDLTTGNDLSTLTINPLPNMSGATFN